MNRVLEASIAELARSGYTDFRMDEVASEAGVNKTSIYRRWPSRSELVTAVVARMSTRFREVPLPDTGNLEDDLIEAFTRRFTVGRRLEGRAWARLVAERHSSEVQSIIGVVVKGRAGEWREMLTRAIARGQLPVRTDTEILLQLVRYAVDGRFNTGRGRLDATWLATAIRTIVAGARAGTLVAARRR